jgi:nitrogen fixation NifU-like protein
MRYSEILLDHFHNPRNVGSFSADETQVYAGKAGDYSRGDIIQLQLKCSDSGIILATRFKAYGSVATIAVGSFICEWLESKTLVEAKNLCSQQIMTSLQLPKVKLYCALLGEDALKTLISR